jgi:hypothetical protein
VTAGRNAEPAGACRSVHGERRNNTVSTTDTRNVPQPPDWLSGEERARWQKGYRDALAWLPVADLDELIDMTIEAAQSGWKLISSEHTLARLVWAAEPDEVDELTGIALADARTDLVIPPGADCSDEGHSGCHVGDVNFRDGAYGAGFEAALSTDPRVTRMYTQMREADEVQRVANQWQLAAGQAREVLDLIKGLRGSH